MTKILMMSILLAACSGGDKQPTAPATPRTRTAAELGPMCDRYYERQRSCGTEYLGALVDVRVEYDMPPGTAAYVKEKGRDAVIAEARVEWERDAAPEKTAAICQLMVEKTPAEHVVRLLKDGEACEATSDCATFATCAIDTERTYITSGAKH